MHPVLFTLPNGFAIHWYGFLIAAGTILAVVLATHWGKQAGLDKDLFTDIGFWAIFAGGHGQGPRRSIPAVALRLSSFSL